MVNYLLFTNAVELISSEYRSFPAHVSERLKTLSMMNVALSRWGYGTFIFLSLTLSQVMGGLETKEENFTVSTLTARTILTMADAF